jgi:type I restriction enzyme, S subunit
MSEWRQVELGQIADVRVSNVDKKTVLGEIPVQLCNYMDVYSNDYIRGHLDFMQASATVTEIARFKVELGDVLITKDSETPDDIGIPSVVTDEIDNLICGYHVALIKPNKSVVDSVYLSKQLGRAETAGYFARYAAGSTRYGLPMCAMNRTPVALPPLAQQRKIATILSTIDTAIEQIEALIEKYQHIKAGLMHDLFTRGVLPTGQLRPPREQAPELYQETAIGWIPREWNGVNLSSVADLTVGFAFKSEWFVADGINLLRGENVGYGAPDWQDRQCLHPEKQNLFTEYLLNPGDVVIGMDRTFTKSGVKITQLAVSDCPALLVQRVGKFVATDCDADYLRWLVVSPGYLRSLFNQQKGMDIPHLSKSEILAPVVPLPNKIEQRLIASQVRGILDLIQVANSHLQKLRQQKLGLMQDLLTGKVQVTVNSADNSAHA